MHIKTIITALIFTFLNILAYAQFNDSFGDSAPCQNGDNANCSKWWTSIDNSKRAVFAWGSALSVDLPEHDRVFCTGTLINQKVNDNDLEQYFITAKHCFEGEDLNGNFVFYFNYQSPDCENDHVPDASDVNGTNRDGRRYRHVSTITEVDQVWGADFAMFKIDNPIPPHFNVYYSGWTKAIFQGTQFPHHMIHHPKGDIKKIAKTWTTITVTNVVCHIVTTIIDAVLGWFGVTVNTEVICTYTELPFYDVPAWSDGCTEGGSSGATLLNSNMRIIGTLSGGPWTGSVPVIEPVGKFNTAYLNSSEVRDALNPNGGYIYNGISGNQIECYNELLNLNGDYFPAQDYQPENLIVLQANTNITTEGDLTIHTGADFEFKAGTSITLNAGFSTEAGAHFLGEVNAPCSSTKSAETYDINSILSGIEIPKYKKFNIADHLPNKNTETTKSDAIYKIFPNPTKGFVNIECSNNDSEKTDLIVYDMFGKEIIHKTYTGPSFEFNLINYSKGLYLVKIISNNKMKLEEKIILQ